MTAYFWALFAALVWGVVPLIEKLGLSKVPVWAGIFYRCMGVVFGIFILLVFKFSDIKNSLVDGATGGYYLILGGFLASVVGQIGFYHALKSGEVSQVTPIAAMYPLVTFVLGVVLLNESITFAKVLGVGCVVLGVILLK